MKIYKINSDCDFDVLCERIRPREFGKNIMRSKANLSFFYLMDLKRVAANILKQDALSVGAELVTSENSVFGGEQKEDALLIVNDKQINALAKKEALQDFDLKVLGSFLKSEFTPAKEPEIMGVLNFNDDSFNAASRTKLSECGAKCEKMIADGAKWIDIGMVSSRPGSVYCGAEAEFARVKPVIDEIYALKLYDKVKFSLDSFDEKCLRYALERGFKMINDISGKSSLSALAAEFGATYCLMHMKGEPQTMQENISDCDILGVVSNFFAEKIAECESFGCKDIVLDVGIGFGKTARDNMILIKNLGHFLHFGRDLLVGASRKSLINAYFPSVVADRLPGTLFLHQKAYENGAKIIRAHDVCEHAQMFAMNKIYEKTTL